MGTPLRRHHPLKAEDEAKGDAEGGGQGKAKVGIDAEGDAAAGPGGSVRRPLAARSKPEDFAASAKFRRQPPSLLALVEGIRTRRALIRRRRNESSELDHSTPLLGDPDRSGMAPSRSPLESEREELEALERSGISGSLGVAASKLLAENRRLQEEVDTFRGTLASVQQAPGGCRGSPRHGKSPQLEAALSLSRARLRGTMQQQLQDSQSLITALRGEVARAEERLHRERVGNETCEE